MDPEHSIQLTVNDINIEPSKDCLSDSLEVYGGPDKSSPMLTKICAFMEPVITVESSGNYMTVVFKSDVVTSGKGFTANYKSIPSSK